MFHGVRRRKEKKSAIQTMDNGCTAGKNDREDRLDGAFIYR